MRPLLSSRSSKGPLALLGIAVLVGLWTACSHFQWVDPLLLPPPERVALAVSDIGWRELGLHIGATLARIIIGFQLAALWGIVIGVAMQYSRSLYAVLDGIIESWRPVPPVALVPFFILIFGFSEVGHLVIIVLGTGLVFVVTTIEALDRVPVVLIQLGLTSGLSRASIYRKILMPAAVGEMRAGVRVALALSITLVVVSEFLGATHGLGYLIFVSKTTLSTATMLLCTLILGALGYLLDLFVRRVFDLMTAWEPKPGEAIR